jgi:cobalt-zinc-cadmium efflux system membrane fusion protein
MSTHGINWLQIIFVLVLVGLVAACAPTASPNSASGHDDDDGHDHAAEAGEHHDDDADDADDAGSDHDGGEADHDDEHEALELTPARLAELGIELAVAGPGPIELTTELPGEVHVNGDRMSHVATRVGGVAVRVLKSLGDSVRAGELMAVLESRELADAKAAFLAAQERQTLAAATASREERLWQQRVSAEQDFLDARKTLAEAEIELRTAAQKLRALDLSDQDLQQVAEQPDANLTAYAITAPFDGVVIEKHLTLGETVAAETPVFTIADLTSVWIDLQVYQKDLGRVAAGQDVRIITNHETATSTTIGFVQPLVGEATRTALARIVMPNHDGMWHPGCFVTALVATELVEVPVRLPHSALIRLEDGDTVVFVEDEHGLEPRPVVPGRRDFEHVEISQGLEPGEHYVARGAFALKSELGKGSFGHGHAH